LPGAIIDLLLAAMASRYMHVITPIHRDLASRLDSLLGSNRDAPIGTN
jgi:hypothetical protein